VINIRIQMYGTSIVLVLRILVVTVSTDNASSLDALIAGLTNLDDVCVAIEDKYLESLREDQFERWVEQS